MSVCVLLFVFSFSVYSHGHPKCTCCSQSPRAPTHLHKCITGGEMRCPDCVRQWRHSSTCISTSSSRHHHHRPPVIIVLSPSRQSCWMCSTHHPPEQSSVLSLSCCMTLAQHSRRAAAALTNIPRTTLMDTAHSCNLSRRPRPRCPRRTDALPRGFSSP